MNLCSSNVALCIVCPSGDRVVSTAWPLTISNVLCFYGCVRRITPSVWDGIVKNVEEVFLTSKQLGWGKAVWQRRKKFLWSKGHQLGNLDNFKENKGSIISVFLMLHWHCDKNHRVERKVFGFCCLARLRETAPWHRHEFLSPMVPLFKVVLCGPFMGKVTTSGGHLDGLSKSKGREKVEIEIQ